MQLLGFEAADVIARNDTFDIPCVHILCEW
jgi:hypothetical protein